MGEGGGGIIEVDQIFGGMFEKFFVYPSLFVNKI
jgi:hypothetical protein